MTPAQRNRLIYGDDLADFAQAMQAAFNAKVLYVESGEHSAGKLEPLNTGENQLQFIRRDHEG